MKMGKTDNSSGMAELEEAMDETDGKPIRQGHKKVFMYMSASFHNAYLHMAKNPPDGFSIATSAYMAYAPGTSAASTLPPQAQSAIRTLNPYLSPLYNQLHILLSRPKVRKFASDSYDLVHSAQSILDTNLPYVMDFEHAAVLSGYNQSAFEREGFRNALKRRLLDGKLKKLLPWSNAAKRSLTNFVKSHELEQKIETVYPVITPPAKLEKTEHEGVNFIFVGGIFYEKGGYDAMLAFDKISEKYDSTLTMVTPIPKEVKERFSKNPKIRMLGPQPYAKVKQLYSQSDVFVMPTHYDTFGFVIPEALSYGLPVLTDNSFSRPELVEHGKTGLVVDAYYSSFREDGAYIYQSVEELKKRREDCKYPTESYINELASSMERFIGEDSLRREMSRNAREETVSGKFSPKAWKEKMGRIYEEASE
jgi:glycosyltransferase involved in cell wall biosynthesis